MFYFNNWFKALWRNEMIRVWQCDHAFVLCAFDTIERRKGDLSRLLRDANEAIVVEGDGTTTFEHVCRLEKALSRSQWVYLSLWASTRLA